MPTNPFKQEGPEDETEMELQIKSMLHGYLDMILREGRAKASDSYTRYFYRLFNNEFLERIKKIEK